MESRLVWKEGMLFEGHMGKHIVSTDVKAPLGHDLGGSPKELVLVGLSSCTAMDVIALLKKYKQPVESFDVDTHAQLSEGKYPMVFTSIELVFNLKGAIDEQKAYEAVHLSQTKYCGVSAMLAKAVPIKWRIVINGKETGKGEANFN